MNIILIGFMGTGKTEVGKRLAEKLFNDFLDTDELIEKSEGKKISDIFKDNGEEYFRNLETEVIETLQDYENYVLSTGGGIVLKDQNVQLLKEIGPIVLLTAREDIILSRMKDKNDRPLLENGDKAEKIKGLLAKRDPIYKSAADYIVDTSDKSVDNIVEEIINHVQNKS